MGLMAGWQTKCGYISKFKIHYKSNFKLFTAFSEVTTLLEQYVYVFKLLYLTKACFNMVAGSVKVEEAIVFLVDPYC